MVISTGHRHRLLEKKTDNKLVGQIHQYIANIYLPGETIVFVFICFLVYIRIILTMTEKTQRNVQLVLVEVA